MNIDILPQSAADAGCGVTTNIIASGVWPSDGYWSCTGDYAQRSITASFTGLWTSCKIVVTCRNHGTEYLKRGGGQSGYEERPFDYTSTYDRILFVGNETITPSPLDVDNSPPQIGSFPANLVAAGSFAWSWGGESAEEALMKAEGTVEIVSIIATFARVVPHGELFCKTDGTMLCNHSGNLLWH